MKKYRVRLTRAPDHEKPDGDTGCGYEFDAPLNELGELDLDAWKQVPDSFPVTRFWAGESDLKGKLVNKDGRHWYFHYDLFGDQDEFAYQFEREIFHEGGYIRMRDHGGDMHMFYIESVSALQTV